MIDHETGKIAVCAAGSICEGCTDPPKDLRKRFWRLGGWEYEMEEE
jgi:hypothetical protein